MIKNNFRELIKIGYSQRSAVGNKVMLKKYLDMRTE